MLTMTFEAIGQQYIWDNQKELEMETNRICQDIRTLHSEQPRQRSVPPVSDPSLKPSRTFIAAVLLACLCSLIASYWELVGLDTTSELLTLYMGKFILVALAYTSIAGPRSLRVWFVFASGVGLLAVAPALPSELALPPVVFWLSVIECITKMTVVATYVNWQLLGPDRLSS
jgi:hypothetical protein